MLGAQSLFDTLRCLPVTRPKWDESLVSPMNDMGNRSGGSLAGPNRLGSVLGALERDDELRALRAVTDGHVAAVALDERIDEIQPEAGAGAL